MGFDMLSRRTLLLTGAALGSLNASRVSFAADPPDIIGPRDGIPDYAMPPYDPSGAQIPTDALDAGDYPSIPAWLDAMQSEMRPGKIASGLYDVTGVGRRRLHTSIYGYGNTRPVLRTATGPCILYFSANDITVQYIRVETPSLAFAYVDRGGNLIVNGEWRSADLEGAERAGSTALQHDSDISGIRILDCEFGCVLPIVFMSQYHRVSDIHIARNRSLSGCAGFACVWSDRFDDIHIY
ncbi:MAG: hypothetical protein RJB62_1327 [Pseudomonadota bacterium]